MKVLKFLLFFCLPSVNSPSLCLPLLDDTPETCIYSGWSPWSACSSATCEKGRRMRQRMLKAQLDLSVPCPHTQDFQPCMGPGCSVEGERTQTHTCTVQWLPRSNRATVFNHQLENCTLYPCSTTTSEMSLSKCSC